MAGQPSYYRARISAILSVLAKNAGRKDKHSPEELLKYGYIHEDLQKPIDEYISKTEVSNIPLTFVELTSFNTWFAMHPEKIAGRELLTTSREFPITIKGTKEEIIATISSGKSTDSNRIRIAKAKAQAKLKLLLLVNL